MDILLDIFSEKRKRMKLNSLELRWIHKQAKDLLYPNLFYVPKLENCGGCFYYPQQREILLGQTFYDMSKGLIFITEEYSANELHNTIAHEWRHYWQYFKKGPSRGIEFNGKIPYQKAIKQYFQNYSERDALLFSHKFSPSSISDYWMGLI